MFLFVVLFYQQKEMASFPNGPLFLQPGKRWGSFPPYPSEQSSCYSAEALQLEEKQICLQGPLAACHDIGVLENPRVDTSELQKS